MVIYNLRNLFASIVLLFEQMFKHRVVVKVLYLLIILMFSISCFILTIDEALLLNIFDSGKRYDTVNPSNISEEVDLEDARKKVVIKKGDSLHSILQKESVPESDIKQIVALANKEKITSKLKVGSEIIFEYSFNILETEDSDLANEQKLLSVISLDLEKNKTLEFIKSQEGKFYTQYVTAELNKVLTKYEVKIQGSVMGSLKKIGLSANSIVKIIEAYSHQIDFQRQIHSGDVITVITEKFLTPDSKFSHHGDIIFASIKAQGKKYEIYRYSPSGKKDETQFFSSTGSSIKSVLLKTPVNVARISSHYGYRKKHPILGYGVMHKGVDFAAPVGTPIYSAGQGVVKFVGWKSGYGKMLVIQHTNKLSTAYAHASKFAKNITVGQKVKQGQVIAYVGSTGNSTGPHLHYEVRINDQQVNPIHFKSAPGASLSGKHLVEFNKYKTHVSKLKDKLDLQIDVVVSDSVHANIF